MQKWQKGIGNASRILRPSHRCQQEGWDEFALSARTPCFSPIVEQYPLSLSRKRGAIQNTSPMDLANPSRELIGGVGTSILSCRRFENGSQTGTPANADTDSVHLAKASGSSITYLGQGQARRNGRRTNGRERIDFTFPRSRYIECILFA